MSAATEMAQSLEFLLPVLYGFVFWHIVNFIVLNIPMNDKHLKREDWLDNRNRYVSFLHGLVGVFLGGY